MTKTIETEWGPVTITLVVCGECGKSAQPRDARGWLRVYTIAEAERFGGTAFYAQQSPSNPLEGVLLCSPECLGKASAGLHGYQPTQDHQSRPTGYMPVRFVAS